MNKRIVCIFLAAVMILTLVLSAVVTASAEPAIDFDDLLGKIPGKPAVTVTADVKEGEKAVISWEATANTTGYEVIIEAKDGDKWVEYKVVTEAVSPLALELPLGSYRAVVKAINGNNNNLYTTSDDAYFAVRAAGGILGDINGDGEVTDADAVYLLRFTLFPEEYPLTAA